MEEWQIKIVASRFQKCGHSALRVCFVATLYVLLLSAFCVFAVQLYNSQKPFQLTDGRLHRLYVTLAIVTTSGVTSVFQSELTAFSKLLGQGLGEGGFLNAARLTYRTVSVCLSLSI